MGFNNYPFKALKTRGYPLNNSYENEYHGYYGQNCYRGCGNGRCGRNLCPYLARFDYDMDRALDDFHRNYVKNGYFSQGGYRYDTKIYSDDEFPRKCSGDCDGSCKNKGCKLSCDCQNARYYDEKECKCRNAKLCENNIRRRCQCCNNCHDNCDGTCCGNCLYNVRESGRGTYI